MSRLGRRQWLAALPAVACLAGVVRAGTLIDLQLVPPDFRVRAREPVAELAADSLSDRTRLLIDDLDGDGRPDLLVGARGETGGGGRQRAGALNVFWGPLAEGTDWSLALTPPDLRVVGPAAGYGLSLSLATGDVDGDGRRDVVLGADGGDGPLGDRRGAGGAWVLFGRPAWPRAIDLAVAPEGTLVHGAAAGARLGQVAAAGDVNGDGVDDLVVAGAHEVVVVFGGGGWPAVLDLADRPPDVLLGPFPLSTSRAVHALAVADLDGDGVGDLLIGTRGERGPGGERPSAGAVRAWRGRPAWPPTLAKETADVIIHGVTGDLLGASLIAADLAGDGQLELVVGAPGRRDDLGAVAVLLGRSSWPATLDLASVAPDVKLVGRTPGGRFGVALAAGDFDGDGRDDLAVSADLGRPPDLPREQAGEVHVLRGRTSWPAEIDLAVAPADLGIVGGAVADRLGRALAFGDVGGDGREDLAIGLSLPGPFAPGDLQGLLGSDALATSCDPGGTRHACGSGRVTLDASGSAGPGPVAVLWRSLSPDLVIDDPTAVVTGATVAGLGPHVVELEVVSGGTTVSCLTLVLGEDSLPPSVACVREVRASSTGPGFARVAPRAVVADECDPDPAVLHVTDAAPGGLGEGAEAALEYPCGVTAVRFVANDAAGHSGTCTTWVVVEDAAPPLEPSGPGSARPLLVRRAADGSARLELSFERRPLELVNVHWGSVPATAGEAPPLRSLACHLTGEDAGAGRARVHVQAPAGADCFLLVSTSNCAGEASLGTGSTGAERSGLEPCGSP